ncbi:membrane-bound alpha-1,6- mannosyltransferase Initiation-specific [Chytriomyces hyalinus]|nr:membrane-bound alpha-1,6- mannosyltransferase Initiation-specific [Chytriomyces hyalinus]
MHFPALWSSASVSQHRWTRGRSIIYAALGILIGASILSNSLSLFVFGEDAATAGPLKNPTIKTESKKSSLSMLLTEDENTKYYPQHPISNISRAAIIPNQLLRTWKANSRADIRLDCHEKRDHPDRYSWFESWDLMNPTTIQIVFNDEDMDRFVRGAFSRRVVEAYFKLPRAVLRSDFGRYLMLYKLGGYYTDMDTTCQVPLYKWNFGMNHVAVIIGVENPSPERDNYLQWTMASAPHHPFLAQVVHRVTEKIHATDALLLETDDNAVLEVTGPGIWKQVVWDYLESKNVNLQEISNMWEGFYLAGDMLILGKAYLNNDNWENPKAFIRHHFTGNSAFGWRVHGKTLDSKQPALGKLNDDFDWTYHPPTPSIEINPSKEAKAVPKEVVQVANSSSDALISSKFKGFRDRWIQQNPGYRFTLLSVEDMDEFVRKGCSSDEQTAFFKLPLFKQRFELFRYLRLLKVGGIYTEIDSRPHTPIDQWFSNNRIGLIIGMNDQGHNEGPGFKRTTLASIPQHPVIASFVAKKVAQILERSQSDLERISFFDFFEHDFNFAVKMALTERGVNVTRDFRSGLAWDGYLVAGDLLIWGQERFNPSAERDGHTFARWHGDLWDKEKGIWEEDAKATSGIQ